MSQNLNENTLTEQPTIDWFKGLGYAHEFGPDLASGQVLGERNSFREVVLIGRLERAIRYLNPDLPDASVKKVITKITKFEHPNLEISNKEIYQMITQGVKIEVRDKSGKTRGRLVKIFDFENPTNNDFLVVNQFAIQGVEKTRRPDIVVFINGIPIGIFELKNPTIEQASIYSAYQQLQDYKKDIPDIFKYNQLLIISDLQEAKHGTISSPWEWFCVWRGIESEDERRKGKSELEVLIKGIFHKARIIDIIKNFDVFEADSDKDISKFTKKMCLYHQYFGVNKAIQETLRAIKPKGNKKIGVFWHTQGSGKTLSMVFYVNKVKYLEELKSPTFVFLTDRNDLDSQFYKTFLRTGYPFAKRASSIKDLKKKLKTSAGELIFATIQKFDIGKEKLSNRENIIVIADEAHRSQYAKLAANVRVALPSASFMGITGTPISLQNRNTRLVFGKHITEYKINRAVNDGATVPIYYEGRLVPLHLTNEFIDEEFEGLTSEYDFGAKEMMKRKWARFEQAISSESRLRQIAKDVVEHFNGRGIEGKGIIATISRKVAVSLYEVISKLPAAPEIAVVISKPEEFKNRIQKELDNKELERRFKNPDDSLKLVIVCDMWLTGFDVPPLHTMYIDKPLKNHTLMQAIARVNRIFRDKKGGLIVDYIGIADNLKKALSIYSSGIQKEAMIPIQEIIDRMMKKYDIVKSMLGGVDFSNWQKLKGAKRAQFFQKIVNNIITDEKSGRLDNEKKKRFIKEVGILSGLFAFAMPHREANYIREDVGLFRAIKGAIIKRTVSRTFFPDMRIESAIRELVSKSISAEGVIDIFDMKGKTKPDISIFDDKFLKEIKNIKYKNLSIEVLRKLLEDELRVRIRKNKIRFKSLMELLQQIIDDYENNIISSAKVIEKLIKLSKEITKAEKVGKNLGLSEEELAFYDAIAASRKSINGDEELKKLVKELVKVIRRDLAIDWTNSDIIQSRIRANVRLLLLRRGFKIEETKQILSSVYEQAKWLYQDYTPVNV